MKRDLRGRLVKEEVDKEINYSGQLDQRQFELLLKYLNQQQIEFLIVDPFTIAIDRRDVEVVNDFAADIQDGIITESALTESAVDWIESNGCLDARMGDDIIDICVKDGKVVVSRYDGKGIEDDQNPDWDKPAETDSFPDIAEAEAHATSKYNVHFDDTVYGFINRYLESGTDSVTESRNKMGRRQVRENAGNGSFCLRSKGEPLTDFDFDEAGDAYAARRDYEDKADITVHNRGGKEVDREGYVLGENRRRLKESVAGWFIVNDNGYVIDGPGSEEDLNAACEDEGFIDAEGNTVQVLYGEMDPSGKFIGSDGSAIDNTGDSWGMGYAREGRQGAGRQVQEQSNRTGNTRIYQGTYYYVREMNSKKVVHKGVCTQVHGSMAGNTGYNVLIGGRAFNSKDFNFLPLGAN